jgi:hypothetical protein
LRARAFVRRAASTVGVVVDFVEETSEERRGDELVTVTTFYPVVHFQTASGAPVAFRSAVGAERPLLSKGQQVPVLYDAGSPQEAKIRSFVQLWWGPLALVFVAALLALVGAALIVR